MNDARASRSLLCATPEATAARALDHLVVRLLRLAAGRRRRALRDVVGLAERRAHVEAADRAVADLERDLAAGRAHVLDHRAAVAREVEIEAAVAA